MKNDQDCNHLSWGDALFLYLEREGMPLNIASVSVFEGDIPLDACIQSIGRGFHSFRAITSAL